MQVVSFTWTHPGPKPATKMDPPICNMTKIHAVSINARGLQTKGVFEKLLRKIKTWSTKEATRHHIYLIQEHNLDPKNRKTHERNAKALGMTLAIGFAPRNPNGVHYGGTMILSMDSSTTLTKILDETSEVTRATYTFEGDLELEFASIYAPARAIHRVDFFTRIEKHLSKHTIAGGDWNCVSDVTLDVQSKDPLGYPNTGARILASKMEPLGLVDFRRAQLLLGNEHEHTRIDPSGTLTRIDKFYTPTAHPHDGLLWSLETMDRLIWSRETKDHIPIRLTIDTKTGEGGHERKTIRENLILEPQIQQEVAKIVKKAYRGAASLNAKWERSNAEIKHYLLNETCRRRAKERKAIRKERALLDTLTQTMRAKGSTPQDAKLRDDIKNRIYELENPETGGTPSADRAHEMAQRSDKSTAQFFRPYKASAKQQWINGINRAEWVEGADPDYQHPDGTPRGVTQTPGEVPFELTKYYQMLFGAKKVRDDNGDNFPELDTLLNKLSHSKIYQATADHLDRPFTEKEVRSVMENLPLGKQAGPNRVPNGVYKVMANIFVPKFTQLLNESTKPGGQLPPSMLEGDICLLYKKASREDVRNYRPLTMLNTDYKMYTRILATRMRDMVHQFVSEMQKGFVPSTFIAEATMLLTLIENYINSEPDSRQGVFIFLDMEKAFDRVSFDFLQQAMKTLNFGPTFRSCVDKMYDETKPPKRRIYANGFYGDWFDIKSGVAQGCPLSPLLFLIVAETLRIAIEIEPGPDGTVGDGVRGIQIGEKRFRISQYADDTALILKSILEIPYANRAIAKWCKATGMKENMPKRNGLAMGRYRKHPRALAEGVHCKDIKWAKEGEWVICLGVPFGNDLDTAKWWKKKVESVRDKATHWVGLFRASYFGRNLIVQAM